MSVINLPKADVDRSPHPELDNSLTRKGRPHTKNSLYGL